MDSTILFSEKQRFRQIWIWLFLLVLDGWFLFKLFNHPSHSQPFNKDFLNPAIVVLLITLLFGVLRLDTQCPKIQPAGRIRRLGNTVQPVGEGQGAEYFGE